LKSLNQSIGLSDYDTSQPNTQKAINNSQNRNGFNNKPLTQQMKIRIRQSTTPSDGMQNNQLRDANKTKQNFQRTGFSSKK
jgi:hypothetical protein